MLKLIQVTPVMVTQTLPLIQPNCAPVGDEFGRPVSVELLKDPDYSEVIDQVGANIEATHALGDNDLETGEAAGRALKALGCAACELDNVCAVRDMLSEKVEIGAVNQLVMEKTEQITAAPTWLKAARFQMSGISSQELRTLLTDSEAAKTSMDDGLLDKLIGDVVSEPAAPMMKHDLPELSGTHSIPTDKPLRTDTIRTPNGKAFTVVDATIGLGSKDDITDESRKEYGILCAKFVERLKETGADGLPQILKQDQNQTMQKTIYRRGDAEIFEMRMSGKNRLYFSVVKLPNEDGQPIARLVILGAHGGNAQTQRAFIDSSLN